MSSSSYDYDILVSGGGVVGACLCAKLLKDPKTAGLKIGLVELKKPKILEDISKSPTPEVQVYALSPSSINFLKKVDAWDAIEPRSQPYRYMQVWEANGPGYLRFSSDDIHVNELGRICENNTIVASLYDSILQSNRQIDIMYGSSITDLTVENNSTYHHSGLAKVEIKDASSGEKRMVTSRLVVGADGANSYVRKASGITSWGWDYGQKAIVATVKLKCSGNGNGNGNGNVSDYQNATAWQKYLPSGPLALLPLWDGYSSIVWSAKTPEATRLMQLSDELFLEELNNALSSPSNTSKWSVFSPNDVSGSSHFQILNRMKYEGAAVLDMIMSSVRINDPPKNPPIISSMVSSRVSIPIQLQKASTYSSSRIALIGDAAHSIHPQAGQGLNLGITDADCLGNAIIDGLKSGVDIGENSTFLSKKYSSSQYSKNLSMMGTVDILNRIYSSELKSVSLLRSLGMIAFHGIGPIKSEIAKFAMGNKIN